MTKSNKSVWLIESNQHEAEEHKQVLNGSRKLSVEVAPPMPSLDSYISLASNPQTGAILIDCNLNGYATGGGAPYNGIDVANYLRALRPELPIFVMIDSFEEVDAAIEEGGPAIDSIIIKDSMRKYPDAFAARILRSMKRYSEALTDRQQRIKELIDLKIAGKLSEDEEAELMMLQTAVTRPSDVALADQSKRSQVAIQEQRETLDVLQQIAQRVANL